MRVNRTLPRSLVLMAFACVASLCGAAPLTIANFGGANGQAQARAFQKPFEQLHRAAVTAVEYSGDLKEVREQVMKRQVQWDVVEVESTDLVAGCQEGLFERIDRSALANVTMMLPNAVHDCGVGAFVWSTVRPSGAIRRRPARWTTRRRPRHSRARHWAASW